MKTTILLLLSTLFFKASFSQKVFFESKDTFTSAQLDEFYSSFNIKDGNIIFNASDYKLHSYNANTGSLNWSYDLRYKSDLPARFVNGVIWANAQSGAVALHPQTGEKIKDLPFASVQSDPLIKDRILYATGIIDGGAAFGYDLNADSILWTRFIAHGCARQPYYFSDKIIANGEGDQWLELNYDGTLFRKDCDTEDGSFPSEYPCVKIFQALTHDNKEIKEMFGESFDGGSFRTPAVMFFDDQTFAFHDAVLTIFGNKLKKKQSTDLKKDMGLEELAYYPTQQILKVDTRNAWLLYVDKIYVYDYKKKKLINTIDLSKWAPHQVEMVDDKIWLISEEDGKLYGLDI